MSRIAGHGVALPDSASLCEFALLRGDAKEVAMSAPVKLFVWSALLLAVLMMVSSEPALAQWNMPPVGAMDRLKAPDAPLPLNHFWCYFVTSSPVGEEVRTQDQFDARPKKTPVQNPTVFCNPVKKTFGTQVSDILFPNDHLIGYFIGIHHQGAKYNVEVKNQFGTQKLAVAVPPEDLLVPTQKKPHDPPKDTDHFKCYVVEGAPANVTVSLEDQFQKAQVVVMEPFWLCNPTRKLHNGVWTEIQHKKAHLVCYLVTQTEFSKKVKTVNQFRREKLAPENPDTLCVPSKKKILP